MVLSALLLPLLLLLACDNPVYNGPLDLTEHQSVWQYLKVYSYYQDRVPESPLDYPAPESLLNAVGDQYTHYKPLRSPWLPKRVSSMALDTLNWEALSDSTVVIRIQNFRSDTKIRFERILPSIGPYPNIVVDLRNNRGGDLNPTEAIIEDLLPANIPFMIIEERKYNKEKMVGETVIDTLRSTRGAHRALANKRFSVLMNGMSASASELLIAALKEGTGAKLVGETTYGKARGQVIIPRGDRDSLQITYSAFRGISPRIGDYNSIGIVPDTIPEAIKTLGEAIYSEDSRNLFYAARILDSSIGPQQFMGRGTFKRAYSTNPAVMYKITPPDPLK
ncbi:S41 family peptidase [Chitinispirillales bacterium ANBcel5]|uniref:S41 family peptidase n=1 Tax=Cellulosispirillum alkaliphilum TaxID=3039283 RepID=UPI002A555A7B|nr:S41 family peptidase [Chitinispirillales bacterium ANBcel5]